MAETTGSKEAMLSIERTEGGSYHVVVTDPDPETGGIEVDAQGLVRLLAAALVQEDIDTLCQSRTLPPHLPGAERHAGDRIAHD